MSRVFPHSTMQAAGAGGETGVVGEGGQGASGSSCSSVPVQEKTAIRKGGGDESGTWYQPRSSNGWFNYF